MSLLAPVTYAIDYSIAEVRGTMVYVKGSGAGWKQDIYWLDMDTWATRANPKGNFSFGGKVPDGCYVDPVNCEGMLYTLDDPVDSVLVKFAYEPGGSTSDPGELILGHLEQNSHLGDAVRAVGFVADSQIVSGGADGFLRYWELNTELYLIELHAQPLFNIPYDLDVPTDGSIVVTGEGGWKGHAGADTLRIWDASGGVLTLTQETQAPIGFVYSVAVSPSPVVDNVGGRILENYWVAASGFYGDILMYRLSNNSDSSDLELYSTTATRKKRTTALDISPDGSLVASASSGGIQIRSFPKDACSSESCVLKLLLTLNHSGSWVFRIAFWPDSASGKTKIVSVTDSGKVKIWTINKDPESSERTVSVHSVDSDAGYSVAWSQDGDGDMIVVGGNGSITVYDPDLKILFRNEDAHAGRVNDVAFSPGGSQIVSGGADGDLKVWGIPTE